MFLAVFVEIENVTYSFSDIQEISWIFLIVPLDFYGFFVYLARSAYYLFIIIQIIVIISYMNNNIILLYWNVCYPHREQNMDPMFDPLNNPNIHVQEDSFMGHWGSGLLGLSRGPIYGPLSPFRQLIEFFQWELSVFSCSMRNVYGSLIPLL